jgi:hypothetical protein
MCKKNPEMAAALQDKYSQLLEMEKKLNVLQSKTSKKRLLKQEIDGSDIAEIVRSGQVFLLTDFRKMRLKNLSEWKKLCISV